MRKSSQVCTSGENLQLLQQKKKEKARLKEEKKSLGNLKKAKNAKEERKEAVIDQLML